MAKVVEFAAAFDFAVACCGAMDAGGEVGTIRCTAVETMSTLAKAAAEAAS